MLDPRSADAVSAFPIADAVNIPLAELPQRTHELPPRDQTTEIAEFDDSARLACDWLLSHSRRATCMRDYVPGPDRANEVGRLWEPTAFLADAIDRISGATALDLACGTGRDAVYLASRGWRVVGVDVLPDALDRARTLAARCAPAIELVDWRAIDLESPDASIDGRFDLITVFRFLHRPLIPRLRNWLNPGGVVVYETFTTTHRDRHGKPARDEHVLRPGELPALFADYAIEHTSESWRGAVHMARLIARRGP